MLLIKSSFKIWQLLTWPKKKQHAIRQLYSARLGIFVYFSIFSGSPTCLATRPITKSAVYLTDKTRFFCVAFLADCLNVRRRRSIVATHFIIAD